jgi:hypothetical protein
MIVSKVLLPHHHLVNRYRMFVLKMRILSCLVHDLTSDFKISNTMGSSCGSENTYRFGESEFTLVA